MEWVMTEWFIRRPIGSSLLMVSLVVAGILGYSELPVDNIPELDFPTLVVTANAGGASATYMERAVTNPLEEKLANIPGIESMRSTSAQNSTTIVVRFRLGRDMNAANQAQAAMDEAKATLSPGLENPPVLAKFNPADQPVLLLSLRSNTLPLWELNDLAQRTISPRLGTIPGVAKISVLGSSEKALRLLYSPVLLNGHHMGPLIMQISVC
jgi:multidrug efflux pump subunit AcrB